VKGGIEGERGSKDPVLGGSWVRWGEPFRKMSVRERSRPIGSGRRTGVLLGIGTGKYRKGGNPS